MTAEPYQQYARPLRGRMGDTPTLAAVGDYINYPSSGTIFVYGGYGPGVSAIVGETAGTGYGIIGTVTGYVTASDGGQWYVVDTSTGATPIMQQFPNQTSNTVYIPTFGDTSNPAFTNLTAAQSSAPTTPVQSSTPPSTTMVANTNTATTASSANPGAPNGGGNTVNPGGKGAVGLAWFQGPGLGNMNLGESLFLGLLGVVVIGVGINQATK